MDLNRSLTNAIVAGAALVFGIGIVMGDALPRGAEAVAPCTTPGGGTFSWPRANPPGTKYLTSSTDGHACASPIGSKSSDAVHVAGPAGPPVVDIVARDMAFDVPDEIPAGWTTFRLDNVSQVTHFALVERLPAGVTLDDYRQGAVAFQALMDALDAGDPLEPVYELFPEWEVEYLGGPGLTSPKTASTTTVYLEPGHYVIECYVKTANGQFHAYLGMVDEFRVTESAAGASPPVPSLELTLSSTRGIEVDGQPTAGEHTVAVHFEDQVSYEHFVGHDVHVVRLEDGTDLGDLERWMNWMESGGLAEPAPAVFLGGTQELPAGDTAYFQIVLEPGDYAWIAEVPDASAKGMLQTFTVE